MITPAYVQSVAAYNRWQNVNLYGAADTLSDEDRRADKGAFFGSLHATLSHLLWGDLRWMSRFAGLAPPNQPNIPASVDECDDWDELKSRRITADTDIVDWAAGLSAQDLAGNLTWYSGAAGRDETKPLAMLIAHFFNHQTHHRGQVHCLLTAAGAKPGDTDLFLMPEENWP
jgi:uncharacterized damage-inducible protein DinB